jgi:transposase InsO family protein
MEPDGRRRRKREWKRWERGRPNELWQMDTVGGFLIADGSHAKALTGLDDHARFCVSARLMPRERTRPVCDGLTAAIGAYGAPEQLLGARLTQNRGTPHHSTAGLGVALESANRHSLIAAPTRFDDHEARIHR